MKRWQPMSRFARYHMTKLKQSRGVKYTINIHTKWSLSNEKTEKLISTGSSWLRDPVLINLFCKQFSSSSPSTQLVQPYKVSTWLFKVLYHLAICDRCSKQFSSIHSYFSAKTTIFQYHVGHTNHMIWYGQYLRVGKMQNRQFQHRHTLKSSMKAFRSTLARTCDIKYVSKNQKKIEFIFCLFLVYHVGMNQILDYSSHRADWISNAFALGICRTYGG